MPTSLYLGIKKGDLSVPRTSFTRKDIIPESHEVGNLDSLVVTVNARIDTTQTLVINITFCEGVGDKTVTSLEADLGLEGVLPDGTNHLEGNVGAVEQTSIVGGRTLVSNDVVLVSSRVSSKWVDVNSVLTIDGSSKGVALSLIHI